MPWNGVACTKRALVSSSLAEVKPIVLPLLFFLYLISQDSGRWSMSPGDDFSSGVFSYSSQPDGQVFSTDWLGHTQLPPPCCFEGEMSPSYKLPNFDTVCFGLMPPVSLVCDWLRSGRVHQRFQQEKHPHQRDAPGEGGPHCHWNQRSGSGFFAILLQHDHSHFSISVFVKSEVILISYFCVSFPCRSLRGFSPWKPKRDSRLLTMRRCRSLGWSSAVFQLQTSALAGDGGSETGCWRQDRAISSSQSNSHPVITATCWIVLYYFKCVPFLCLSLCQDHDFYTKKLSKLTFFGFLS